MADKHVYGGVLKPRFEHVKEKHGKDGIARLLAKMKEGGYDGPEDPEKFKIANPYPVEYYLLLLNSYKELYGDKNLDLMSRDMPRRKGVVGWLVKWEDSPEQIIQKADQYWKNFYDFGRLEGSTSEGKRGVVKGFDVSVDPITCRVFTHYFTGILETAGAKKVEIYHSKCVHKGNDHCEWNIGWA